MKEGFTIRSEKDFEDQVQAMAEKEEIPGGSRIVVPIVSNCGEFALIEYTVKPYEPTPGTLH